MQERLKELIWLAVQTVKVELFGGEGHKYQELVLLAGVTTKNWSRTFTHHWVTMKYIFQRLDSGALLFMMRTRSRQKAALLKQSAAKVDWKAHISCKSDILPTLYVVTKANKTRPQTDFLVSLISNRHGECAGGGAKGGF